MMNPGTLTVTTPTDREILMTRVFDAPRELVFEAMSRAELLKRWLSGPPGWTMVECESDARAGGTFRHLWRNTDGSEMSMRGVYREVVPPERIVRTEAFAFGCDSQLGEQLGTLVLTEQGSKTKLTLTVLYPSKKARDATIASGMERGVSASYDRLDAELASQAPDFAPSVGFKTIVTATLAVRNWAPAVEFYKAAFGAREMYRVEGGGVAQLSVSGAEFWVAEESLPNQNFSPEALGGCSVRMLLIVPDPAAICMQAVAVGATQVSPVRESHGWRIGRIVDPFGHHWEIARQLI
jgi:uncharacterized protein YndB with AHSA1/START domain/uncharacterized glyoxalase superfamily protein PhnB